MRIFLKEEKGSAMVLSAIAIVVLIGFMALAVDGGFLYSRHTQFQDIADAMALAGATQMGETTNKTHKRLAAFKKAVDYAEKNKLVISSKDETVYTAQFTYLGDETGTVNVEVPDTLDYVKVTLNLNANLFFGKIFGSSTSAVKVSATAIVGQSGIKTGGLVPVGILGGDPTDPTDDYVTGVQYEMTLGPSEGSSGNYGYLNFEPSNYFNDYMQYGYDGTLNVGDTVQTYPGVDVGLVTKALGERIQGDTHTFEDYDENCPRIIYTPIIDQYGESGTSEVTILGFAAFFLEEYRHEGSDITLVGRFIEEVEPEEIAPSSLNYTVHAVKLVD